MEAVGAVAAEEEATESLDTEVETLHDAAALATRIREVTVAGEPYAIEARWEGAQPHQHIAGFAIATADGRVTYADGVLLHDRAVTEAGGALVAEGGPPLIAHRAKELMHGLGTDVRTLAHDTAVMAYLLDPGEGKYLLEDLALRYLSLEVRSPDVEEGTLDFDGGAATEETGRRAVAILRLARALAEALDARELTDLYVRIEQPLVRVLAKMEDAGIKIDRKFLDDLSAQLNKECDALMRRIWGHAGEEFNVNSTPQLRIVLFEKLGLTPVKKTKTGPSTDADSLQKMAQDHPIVEDLLRYREVEKLRSTYADALPPLIGPDGRVHATFNQIGTTTGRISSESPNLQNVPVR
ncbi:MAG: DNA polymerase, partial [Dehalococcoidia bacterium]